MATVTTASRVYDRKLVASSHCDCVLREIDFQAVCPMCGDRVLVERQTP